MTKKTSRPIRVPDIQKAKPKTTRNLYRMNRSDLQHFLLECDAGRLDLRFRFERVFLICLVSLHLKTSLALLMVQVYGLYHPFAAAEALRY